MTSVHLAMVMMTSMHFTKTQKSRYLENETLFFLQIKKFINYTSRATLLQKNSFVADVTFNNYAPFIYLCKVDDGNTEQCLKFIQS